MSKQFTNFYETIDEARIRLDQTVVLYDGEPYYVLCICRHPGDDIFRMYLDPYQADGLLWSKNNYVPYEWHDEPGMTKMQKMDEFLNEYKNKSCPIIRKMMNSPLFNKFRPFSLGMGNGGGKAGYIERSPVRHTQQGLTGSMLTRKEFDLVVDRQDRSLGPKVSLFNPQVHSAITGRYPDVDTVLSNLTDKKISNSSVAFHREFAVVRGPLNLLFVAYRGEIVGFLPNNNTSQIKITDEYNYVKEVVDELHVFNAIV